MRLKSFYAKTLTEAMQMIRDTLGEDAIIVATREENGGRTVRVTAAIDPRDGSEGTAGAPYFELGQGGTRAAESNDWLQYDTEQDADENSISEDLTDVMLAHSVPEDVTDQVLSCAMIIGYRDTAAALEETLDHLFQFRPLLPARASSKPFILVGPPGAGKTLLTAKLAARSVMDGHSTGVITADTVRAGGVEQLEAFTRILNIDLKRVQNAADLAKAVQSMKNIDRVFIDTPGTSPYDTTEVKELARLLTSIDAEPVLAMPAGLDATESGEIARIFSAVGVRRLLATRLDIGRRLGGLLAAAHQGGLTFAEGSDTPQVADGLTALTPRYLARLLLPRHRKDSVSQPQARQLRTTSG